MTSFAQSLALKKRHETIWKWPMGLKVRIFFQCDPESLQHFIVFFNLCNFVALKDNTMNWKVIF